MSSNYFNEKYGIICEFLKILEFLVQFVREQLANNTEDSINLLRSLGLIIFKAENTKKNKKNAEKLEYKFPEMISKVQF